MIAINELRIGNYIQHSEDSIWGCIDKFYGDEVFIVDWHYGTTELKECEPIPLNDEWLLKFGFNKNRDQLYFGKGSFIISWWGIYNEIDLDIEGQILTIQCNSIHQLQNLYFALAGEELKANIL